MHYRTSVALLVLSFGLPGAVRAHDPGLSSVRLDLFAERSVAELTFARRDVEFLVPIDGDGRPARSALILSLDGRPLAARAVEIELEERDTLRIELVYPAVPGGRLEVSSPLIERLSRGHRQHLQVWRDGDLHTETMLDAGRSGIGLDLAATPARTGKLRRFGRFVGLGVEHILLGYDHLLFLFGLLIVGGGLSSAGRIITSFTVAHSITLALATFEIVRLPAGIVEPLIAVSVIWVGVENLLRRDVGHRLVLTFGFGLVHGLGFASVLGDLGIASANGGVTAPLIAFNAGVELGQIAVAALVLPVVWKLGRSSLAPRLATGGSTLVALAGAYWLLARLLA